jgi:8-oxo-dGTP diphosphatase
VVGYKKGTDVAREMAAIKEAVARIGAAMQSDPEPASAFADATALEKLGSEISEEASGFRAWFLAELHDQYHIPQARLARMLKMSTVRVNQLVKTGRQRKGNPVMDPGTLPELAPVAVGIVTTDKGVLIAHRRDERPPWTFPGGEIQPGESPADALRRRIPQETGVDIKVLTVLGRRVHPRTNRLMVYLACQAADDATEPQIGEAAVDDLDAAEYAGLDVVRERMPDMFDVVRVHLEAILGQIGQF